MALQVKDETAGVVILTIDNFGRIAFGDGTPASMLTVGPNGIIDLNGQVIHGLKSGNFAVASGSGTLSYHGSGQAWFATIQTHPGSIPVVQIDTEYPSYIATDNINGGDPNQAPVYKCVIQASGLNVGSFDVNNTSSGTATAAPACSGAFGYRYL